MMPNKVQVVTFFLSLAILVGRSAIADAGSSRAAQPGVRTDTAPTVFQPGAQERKNPYANLFGDTRFGVPRSAPPSQRPQAAERARELDRPTVVCGMTLIPIDPNVDPGIYLPPLRTDTRHTIRAITPPICKSPDRD